MEPTPEDVRAARHREGRWLLVCVTIALGALLYAAVVGQEWWGKIIAFVLAAAVGWVAHLQWGDAVAAEAGRRRGRGPS